MWSAVGFLVVENKTKNSNETKSKRRETKSKRRDFVDQTDNEVELLLKEKGYSNKLLIRSPRCIYRC